MTSPICTLRALSCDAPRVRAMVGDMSDVFHTSRGVKVVDVGKGTSETEYRYGVLGQQTNAVWVRVLKAGPRKERGKGLPTDETM